MVKKLTNAMKKHNSFWFSVRNQILLHKKARKDDIFETYN